MDLIVLLLSTKIDNHAQTKGKNKMGVIKNTILGILGLAVVGGATAMAIPQSRNWCLDQIAKHSTIYKTAINERDDAREDAKNKQETINNLNKTVAEKEQALKEAEELIATKNAEIAEKDATIADKQKTIEEKDAEIVSKQSLIEAKDKTIAEKQATIDEQTTSINTLTTQKTSLLSAVTEIDNKINSTSDAVEIDNLETRKTAILTQIEELDSQIETLTSQKTKLENDVKTLQADKTQLQSEVDALTTDKTNLQNQVNTLTSEKTQLQQEVTALTTEKQNLQSQIDTLNAQLAEFEQYTLNIDQTNPVESITIEDTKLGTSATMSNVNITTLNLYSWQNATIKYAPVDGSPVKATLNGTSQEADTVTIVGSENKGSTVSIGTITELSRYVPLETNVFNDMNTRSPFAVNFNTQEVALNSKVYTLDVSAPKQVVIDDVTYYRLPIKDANGELYFTSNPSGSDALYFYIWVDNYENATKGYWGYSTDAGEISEKHELTNYTERVFYLAGSNDYTGLDGLKITMSDDDITLSNSSGVVKKGKAPSRDNVRTVTWEDGTTDEITIIINCVIEYNGHLYA